VHIPSDCEQLEQFGLSVKECLKQMRRLPTGDIVLNQIKFAVPLAVSPAIAENPEIRNLQFDISVNVIIMPIVVRYMQGGYREVFGEMVESSHPGHNPSRGAFWRRAGTGAQTEALDNDAASKPGIGSKAVIRFSNAQMSSFLAPRRTRGAGPTMSRADCAGRPGLGPSGTDDPPVARRRRAAPQLGQQWRP
jgi:hypothetical protein